MANRVEAQRTGSNESDVFPPGHWFTMSHEETQPVSQQVHLLSHWDTSIQALQLRLGILGKVFPEETSINCMRVCKIKAFS